MALDFILLPITLGLSVGLLLALVITAVDDII